VCARADNLQITVDYLDKMKDQVIIIGLNINVLKHDSTKKKLELLLNMFGLQAVTNVPTGHTKRQNLLLSKKF
jgi:hypothetical protein